MGVNHLDWDKLKGDLKIASTVGYAETCITNSLPKFLNRYPYLNISLVSTDLDPELILKTADISIHPKKEGAKGLVQEFLISNKIRLYASQKYLDKFGTPKEIEDLDNHKLIAFGGHSDDPFEKINFHLRLGREKNQPRKAYLQMNSPRTRCIMAANDMGITSLPEWHHELEKYNLVEVLQHIDHPVVDMYIIYPEYLKDFKKIYIFRDFLKEFLSSSIG